MAEKLDILAIAAHPDDTELTCSGTLAKLAKQGKRVGVLDLTQGEMGTRGTPEQRLVEAQNAAKILGLTVRKNLGLPDCGLVNSENHRNAIMEVVREHQPDICLINAPDDRHPDHRNASLLTSDALFYSGLEKIRTTDASGNPQKSWRPFHILHYLQHWNLEPTLIFDVSDTLAIREKAILAFESQFNASTDDDELQTYVSKPEFFEALRGRARHYGQMIGVEFGEPFIYRGSAMPFSDFDGLLNHKAMN